MVFPRKGRSRAIGEEGVVGRDLERPFCPGSRLMAADCGYREKSGAAGSREDFGRWPGQRVNVHGDCWTSVERVYTTAKEKRREKKRAYELKLEYMIIIRRHLAAVSRARLKRTWIDGLFMLIRKSQGS